MSSCKDVHPGDIWLTYLHFIDKPETGKVRPVLVVDVREEDLLVVALKVTSKTKDDGRRDMAIENWQSAGLVKPSYIRLDQAFELRISDLLRDEPLGAIDESLLEQVLTRVREGR